MIAKEFVIPKTVKVEEGATDQYAQFIIEPFERGYGTTVGNSLRRVLLASLEGSAVTAIRIEGVQHEFSAIPGIKEDVTDIVLNLKRCQIRLNREEPLIFQFKTSGEGEVTAGQLFADHNVEVFNPEEVICSATSSSASLDMEIKVARGRGFKTADQFELEHAPLGTIYLDANFSPVTRVNFLVEDARVGQQTDYDRLILDVWTNGSIRPEAAVEEAAELLIDHFRILVSSKQDKPSANLSLLDDPEMVRKLSIPVDDLELSGRAANCLKAAKIRTVGDLVVLPESKILDFDNFGKKSLDELKNALESMGLYLGMNLNAESPTVGGEDSGDESDPGEDAPATDEEE